MIPLLREDMVTEYVVPTLTKACSDKVPNVQFCASKIISKNKTAFNADVLKEAIVPKLKEMAQNGDKDVAYYAKCCLDDIN